MENLAALAQPILSIPTVRRVRRNHGLEHATIHLLARNAALHRMRLRLAGRSDHRGFYLYGDVATEEVERALAEALSRMRSGEHELAVHPNCGTNLLTTGVMASAAALLGTAGMPRTWQDRLERFPTIVLMVIGALLLSPFLGSAFQRHFTTLGDPGAMEIVEVRRHEVAGLFGGKLIFHRINTAKG
jgi:hypothetical protein